MNKNINKMNFCRRWVSLEVGTGRRARKTERIELGRGCCLTLYASNHFGTKSSLRGRRSKGTEGEGDARSEGEGREGLQASHCFCHSAPASRF